MSRRSAMKLVFAVTTAVLSVAYYHIYMSLDTLAREALLEMGDTTYYPPENKLEVFAHIVLVMSSLVALGMALVMFGFYILSVAMCDREVRVAVSECEQQDGEIASVITSCHWYSFDWIVTGSLPNGTKFERSSGDNFFDVVPFIHS